MPSPGRNLPFALDDIWQHEHAALKALSQGEADAYQQATALELIVKKLCLPDEDDVNFIPGSFDETAFLLGREWVAQQIRALLKKPVSKSPVKPAENNDA